MTDANGPAARFAAAPGTSAAVLEQLLDTLHEPAVRDLAWLLLSADLLRAQPPVGALASPFDTPQEAEYYRNGGILPYVVRQLAARA